MTSREETVNYTTLAQASSEEDPSTPTTPIDPLLDKVFETLL